LQHNLTLINYKLEVIAPAQASLLDNITTRNILIYDEFFVTILENIINMHDL
jgi:hypothetical protein